MTDHESGVAAVAVGMDMSILRHPFAGSSRWATGLLRALRERPELDIQPWIGPRRVSRGGLPRKVLNLLIDSYWLDVELARRARETGRDVLLMPVNLTSARARVPQVVTIHDLNFLVEPQAYDRAYGTYARRMFEASARRAAAITTVSLHSRDQIVDRLGVDRARITVIYPGLEKIRSVPAHPAPLSRPYGLYVGATEPHKNVPTLVEAWRHLSDVELDLAIVGQPGRDHARVVTGALASGGRVHVVGRVSDETLESWYAHARLFVFPSRAEGFGYPPLEAMRRGLPVVASRAGSLPEVLGQAALYHEPGDAAGIATHVRRLLEDEVLASRLIEAGRTVSSRYTWSHAAAIMARVLGEAARDN
jgi:glycosyltransferase involved in cell wall biosynthesis